MFPQVRVIVYFTTKTRVTLINFSTEELSICVRSYSLLSFALILYIWMDLVHIVALITSILLFVEMSKIQSQICLISVSILYVCIYVCSCSILAPMPAMGLE